MNKNRFVLVIFVSLFCLRVNAQLSTEEIPVGFDYNFGQELVSTIVMPTVDTVKLQAEDREEEQLGIPPRFGFKHSVDINLLDVGTW